MYLNAKLVIFTILWILRTIKTMKQNFDDSLVLRFSTFATNPLPPFQNYRKEQKNGSYMEDNGGIKREVHGTCLGGTKMRSCYFFSTKKFL